MKTQLLYKLTFILFLLPTIVLASNWNGKHTKEKTIKKEFTYRKLFFFVPIFLK